MRRAHENVATVLVDPRALVELELELMSLDLRLWPVRTAPICPDGARAEFQLRRTLVERHHWHCAASWVPVWISFGPRWRTDDGGPLPWEAHAALWQVLDRHAEEVRFRRRLGGVEPLVVRAE